MQEFPSEETKKQVLLERAKDLYGSLNGQDIAVLSRMNLTNLEMHVKGIEIQKTADAKKIG